MKNAMYTDAPEARGAAPDVAAAMMQGSALSRRGLMKLFAGATVVGLGTALAGCDGARGDASSNSSSSSSSQAGSASGSSPSDTVPEGSAAVVYFSWSGRTQAMAERIGELSGATVFRINPTNAYPEDYNECTDVALEEQRAGELPTYEGDVDGWSDIQTVYVGYPIWWMDLPQVVKSFVEDHDWSGKTVVPFCSYYSSQWSGTDDDLADMTGASTVEGIAMQQDDVDDSVDAVDTWYAGIASA